MSILSFPEALATVLTHAATTRPTATEDIPLAQALYRTLATPLHADRDQPPFDRSTRDGYAIRSADTGPRTLIGSIRAGEAWTGEPLAQNQAIEIMTGAPVPSGADAVLMLEHALLTNNTLTTNTQLAPGTNIVPRAAEARAGVQLLPTGQHITAAEIAVAASCGATHLNVFTKPRVAILATGDELVDLDITPAPHQIRNSNSHSLAALVEAEGGHPGRMPITRDTIDGIEGLDERIAQGSMWDLLLLSGGVSAGKFDLVEQVLANHNAEFFFTGALIQPGKPIVFGRIPKRGLVAPQNDADQTPWNGAYTYFFGLPGNPISTQVCFHLFVAPLLRALCGRTDTTPRFVEAKLTHNIAGGAKVTRFLPAELTSTWDSVTVTVLNWQGSGDIATNARANCYAVLPINTEHFTAGETIRVLLR